jgi:putative ABC transport system permease protein
LGLHVGDTWPAGGRTRRVVGVVENPLNLSDQFALVWPGQIKSPDRVSVLVNASPAGLQSLHLASGTGLNVMARGTASQTVAEALVLVLGTLGLLFAGLMAVAGFTVMAHRRLRSLGMLGALGATDGNIRLVMLANGAAVGITAAALGTIVGLVAWLTLVPTLESAVGHRIDRFALPWWAIATAMTLTFTTAVAAAWWPARAVSRISVMAALSGRPPDPSRRIASRPWAAPS